MDIILHPRHPLPRPPELEAAGAAVSGQQAHVVHAGAAVVADVVPRVQVARALAPPLPGLKTIILDKNICKNIFSKNIYKNIFNTQVLYHFGILRPIPIEWLC